MMAQVMTIGREGAHTMARGVARSSTYARQAAVALALATTLSMIHTVYSAFAFDMAELRNPAYYVIYAVLWGLVALMRTDRRAAWWTVAIAMALFILVGIFYYPTIFVPARQTPFGWFENDLYMGLLILTEYLAIQRLRGIAIK